MSAAQGRAYARAALLGNPSDGSGGRTIALAMRNFAAEVTVEASRRTEMEPGPAEPLLAATVKRFHDHLKARGEAAAPAALRIRRRTSIPRELGLGGSSAIVIAALRALCALHDTSIPAESLPSVALSVETEELGIEAGLQDRVAQSYEGLTFMGFEPRLLAERGHGAYERLDLGLLPPLLVAHRAEASEPSSRSHATCAAATRVGSRRSARRWTRSPTSPRAAGNACWPATTTSFATWWTGTSRPGGGCTRSIPGTSAGRGGALGWGERQLRRIGRSDRGPPAGTGAAGLDPGRPRGRGLRRCPPADCAVGSSRSTRVRS